MLPWTHRFQRFTQIDSAAGDGKEANNHQLDVDLGPFSDYKEKLPSWLDNVGYISHEFPSQYPHEIPIIFNRFWTICMTVPAISNTSHARLISAACSCKCHRKLWKITAKSLDFGCWWHFFTRFLHILTIDFTWNLPTTLWKTPWVALGPRATQIHFFRPRTRRPKRPCNILNNGSCQVIFNVPKGKHGKTYI